MKLRYPTWYWGNYIEKKDSKYYDQNGKIFPISQVCISSLELYLESKHGWKNSEEYKTGYKLNPYV